MGDFPTLLAKFEEDSSGRVAFIYPVDPFIAGIRILT